MKYYFLLVHLIQRTYRCPDFRDMGIYFNTPGPFSQWLICDFVNCEEKYADLVFMEGKYINLPMVPLYFNMNNYILSRAILAHPFPFLFRFLIWFSSSPSPWPANNHNSVHFWCCTSRQPAKALFNKTSPLPRAAMKWTVTPGSQLKPGCWHWDCGVLPSPALSQIPPLKHTGRPQAGSWTSHPWQAHTSQGASPASLTATQPAEMVPHPLQRMRDVHLNWQLPFVSRRQLPIGDKQGKANAQ